MPSSTYAQPSFRGVLRGGEEAADGFDECTWFLSFLQSVCGAIVVEVQQRRQISAALFNSSSVASKPTGVVPCVFWIKRA